jgi:capsular exopolysaccharide synthesis family protein
MNEIDNVTSLNFEPHSLLRDIVRNLWVILLSALIGLMAVNIYIQTIFTPLYKSTATMIVNLKNTSTYSYSTLASSTEMAKIYAQIFKQSAVEKKAAEYLDLDKFIGKIDSEVLTNTNIFTVSVTTPSPELSYNELSAILAIYPQISESVFSNSVIEIMRSPKMPLEASNLITTPYIILISLACALVTLGIIVLLSLLRDTVKDEDDFNKKIDSNLLGTIAHEKPHLTFKDRLLKKKNALLITNAFASFRFTESYQKIATKLEFLQRSAGEKIFLVTSIAEDEGKSTTAANIALALANRQNKVALLDMDFKKPALQKVFSVDVQKTNDFGSLIANKITAKDFALQKYKNTNLYLALNSTSHPDYVDWINSERVTNIINAFRSMKFDYIIIDSSPISVSADITSISKLADKTVLVVRTDSVYTEDINDTIETLKENGVKIAGCILNNVYREFTLMGQLGFDETGNYRSGYGYHGYGNYSK